MVNIWSAKELMNQEESLLFNSATTRAAPHDGRIHNSALIINLFSINDPQSLNETLCY